MSRRSALLFVALVGCSEPPAAPPAEPPPAEPPPLSQEEQAHREAELRDWLAVDELAGRCYEPVRARDPLMHGSVSVRFTIMPDGHARDVVIESATPHDETAEACIVRAVEAMPFTPSATPVVRTIERRFED